MQIEFFINLFKKECFYSFENSRKSQVSKKEDYRMPKCNITYQHALMNVGAAQPNKC